MMGKTWGKIAEMVAAVQKGEVSARANVEKALDLAERCKNYNIFVNLTRKRALQKAEEIDQKLQKGEKLGELAGVPYVLKDNFLDFGADTTASAKMLAGFVAPLQATAVKKLEAAGAICIGKSNLDAFAHGGSTENSFFGVTKNFKDTERVAGGSSGGSAVAVALGVAPFALGTDTGGSIRQPAAFNGVIGVKPTFGSVSRFGVVAMASSTDTIGCFATNAADARLVMKVLGGKDSLDSTTIDNDFTPRGKQKLHIGVIADFMTDDVDQEVLAVVRKYIQELEKNGNRVETVEMPLLKYALPVYYVVVPAEVASNLARYDGIRYGHRAKTARTLGEIYGLSRDEGFMPENKRRIMIGNFVLSSGFFDAYYLKAEKVRTLIVEEYQKAFAKFDVLVCPTTPSTAFKIGENTDNPVKMYLEDVMTVPPSLAGLPAISVPAGRTKSGLDVGAQLIGARGDDALLLDLAESVENKKLKDKNI
ncbi:MAG: Asp-tRNA(Asn)/Glu-tRNA(Gln) amidotransferase subunit GatA [Candidatus Nomurabacteria bacterium]|jgi:aspartyl-tRNA(Asn)/glutamyl-tRNA(Gln) amidotransferase subunit A|nr:Asp-tRNA(Asn)/Glu-tRNA(Gln) amidotransferase subunit GatA [Candidatus Nomurabacteria bacterium]